MLNYLKIIRVTGKNQQGMTLIEVLFSFGLLAIFALTSLRLITMSQQLTVDTQSKLIAIGAARSVMEMIKTNPLSEVDTLSTSGYLPADLPGGSIQIVTSPSGAALDTAEIATVTVAVSWVGSKGRALSTSLSILKSAYDYV
jgi:Tfp pilus assembly protein PilV